MSKSRLLAATFVRLGLPLVDLLATGGAATAVAGTAVASTGLMGRLVGEASKLAQGTGEGIVCDWVSSRLKRGVRDPLKNHDLTRVTGDAIAAVIAQFGRERGAEWPADSPQRAQLDELARGASAAWQALPSDEVEETDLPKLLSGQARAFEEGGGLDESAWQRIVRQLIERAVAGRRRISSATAEDLAAYLHERFPAAVRELLKQDASDEGEAYAGLVLMMLGEILAAVQEHPEHEVAGRVEASITALRSDLREDLARLGATLDANAVERHQAALARLDRMQGTLDRAAETVDRTYEVVLSIAARQEATWQEERLGRTRPHPDTAGASGAGTPLAEVIGADAEAADPWAALLDVVNGAALQRYRAITGTATNGPASAHPDLDAGHWDAYLTDLARWVEVPDEVTGAPADAQVVSLLLESGATPRQPLRLWIVAEPGTGKTTLLYRSFVQVLELRASGESRFPRPMLIQPHLLQPESIQRLNETAPADLIETLTEIWLQNRGLCAPEGQLPALARRLQQHLEAGTIALFIDSFDELSRMRVQRHLAQGLFATTRRFVCASRVEAYRDVHGDRLQDGYAEVRLAPTWQFSTIRAYLNRRLSGQPDDIAAVLAEIRDHDKADYLRNARYLSLLVHFYEQGYRATVTAAATDHAEAFTASGLAGFLAAARCGEYELLTMLYDYAVERLLKRAEARGMDAGPALTERIREAFEQIARDQLRHGACMVPAEQIDAAADGVWALVRDCTDFLRPVRRVGEAYDLGLKNFTLIDFFLTRPIAAELQSERGAVRFNHLWSSDLLMFLSAELRSRNGTRSRNGAPGAALYERLWSQLDRARMDPASLPAEQPCRPSSADDAERFRAVNLVQLAIRLKQDAIDPAGQHSPEHVRSQITFRHYSPDLAHLYLEGVDLSHLRFDECRFDGAVLANARLDHAVFTDCSMRQVNLRNASAAFATFTDCTFDFFDYPRPEGDGATPSPVTGALVHHAEIDDFSLSRTTFRDFGARTFSSRYLGAFGRAFFQQQSRFLGPELKEAERQYLRTIRDAIRDVHPGADRPVYLVDLMAGGASDKKKRLIASTSHLHVLAVDRDTHQLRALSDELGPRYAIKEQEIAGRAGIADGLNVNFGVTQADLIVGKKALHELPRADQRALIHECAESLAPGGHLIILADAPASISAAGYDRLQQWAEPLRASMRSGSADLDALESVYLDEVAFADTADDAAIFSNLWVLMKDWANGNEHEVEHRYFSSADEIRAWATTEAGLTAQPAPEPFHYRLAARRFNEEGVNWVGLYLNRTNGVLRPADRASVRHHLLGGPRHRLFYRFADRHLWDADADRPTPLGARLQAVQERIAFRDIYPALGAIQMPPVYERATAFQFSVYLLHFRNGS